MFTTEIASLSLAKKKKRSGHVRFLILFLIIAGFSFSMRSHAQVAVFPVSTLAPEDYVEGQVIFRLKAEFANYAKANHIDQAVFQAVLQMHKASNLRRVFPNHQPPAQKTNQRGETLVDLSLIYEFDFAGDQSIQNVINALYATGMVEYAEPRILPRQLYVPNDPMLGSQYNLARIRAFDAWDISKGDTSVVIAIVDTGNDRFHPDLINSIAYNYNDPIDGRDNDNDGFTDNFYGWDLANNNNDPQFYWSGHGTHVSGIAAATADNGTGIAGVGFHSRYMTVKVDDEEGRLVMAYEGIVYAADRGAKVINCSWGSPSGAGRFGRDIVDYATFNRDVLVVAAAGNDNNTVPYFPATYERVLSVAATNASDIKWSGSSFNPYVDISAPGATILSTFVNAIYISSSGTSMAAPAVSGAAAILRHHFPNYSARQTAAQLKVTADNIDALPGNVQFARNLGTGRLNMFRALTETHHSYVELKEHTQNFESFGQFRGGQTIMLTSRFENLLAPSGNIMVRLTPITAGATVRNPEISLGAMQTGQISTNLQNPFEIKLQDNLPPNHQAFFMLEFFNHFGQFAGREVFGLLLNTDFINLRVNQLTTTVTSKGNLGFNYPDYSQGLGFVLRNGRNLVRMAGLMVGLNPNRVVDNIYGAEQNTVNQFFVPVQNASLVTDPKIANVEVSGSFTDANAGLSIIGLKTDYRAMLWTAAPNDKFIILEYKLINTSTQPLSGLHAGFFANWVIPDPKSHRAAFDAANRMGYAFSADGGHFSGISLLTPGEMTHYAFDNNGASGSINISDGFTTFEKHNALRNNRSSAGTNDTSNNISTLVSSGPHFVAAGDTLKVAFAIFAGDHRIGLRESATAAYNSYHGIRPVSIEDPSAVHIKSQFARVFPVPFGHTLFAEVLPNQSGKYLLSLTDMSGRLLFSRHFQAEAGVFKNIQLDLPELKAGNYILKLESGTNAETIKVVRIE